MALWKYTDEYLDAINRWDGIMSAPSKENRKRPEGIQIVANPVLERFFGTSPWWGPAIWFFPLIGYCLHRSINDPTLNAGLIAGLMGGGVIAWTLLEYILHRWIFHANPGDSVAHKRRLFMMHGYHHEFPSDRRRLVAPPALSWPLAAIIVPAFYFLFGPHNAFPVIAGTVVGYLAYDWVHYYTHHARPRTRMGKYLRRFHLEHHFKDQDTHYGLSSPLWDLILATYTRPSEQPTQDELDCLSRTAAPGSTDAAA